LKGEMAELTAQTLTTDALLELARRTDPVGVVSVYVHADPGEDPRRRGAAIEIGNRLDELQRRVSDEGPPQRARAVEEGLERVRPQIDALTAPTQSGRGRALFCALSDGSTTRFWSQMPLVNRVVLDTGAFIHPLLELADEGRPAGIVLAAQDGARVLDWRLEQLTEVASLEPEVVEAPHERSGPVGASPASRPSSPKREQRVARERDRVARFIDGVAAVVEREVQQRGWERVLISGGERLTQALAGALPASMPARVLRDPRVLARLPAAELSVAIGQRLHEDHREHEAELLQRAGEEAAARGLSAVAGALNEGRAAHLLYDPDVRYQGMVDADGALFAAGEEPPGGRGLTPEPRLTERLVERALGTGARVTPIEGAADGALADADGIAALLRW
jgi:hypothetical protein